MASRETTSLKVTFELDQRDLRHFKREMQRIRRQVRVADDEEIIHAARVVLDALRATRRVPMFVQQRLVKLESMIAMINDTDWRLAGAERAQVINALAYFGDPEDLIPDDIPGLGFLDDAIMIELVFRELVHEVEAYEDFCRFRDDLDHNNGRDESRQRMRLSAKRKALRARVHRRKQKLKNQLLAK